MFVEKETVATKLRMLRAKEKETQEDLANFMGVSPSTVVNWEQGKTIPNFYEVRDLADHFNVSIEEFLRA